MKDVRKVENTHKQTFPEEIIDTGDIDFIGNDQLNITAIEVILLKHSLKVNVSKTEHTQIRKDFNEWRTTEKVRSLLSSKEGKMPEGPVN